MTLDSFIFCLYRSVKSRRTHTWGLVAAALVNSEERAHIVFILTFFLMPQSPVVLLNVFKYSFELDVQSSVIFWVISQCLRGPFNFKVLWRHFQNPSLDPMDPTNSRFVLKKEFGRIFFCFFLSKKRGIGRIVSSFLLLNLQVISLYKTIVYKNKLHLFDNMKCDKCKVLH